MNSIAIRFKEALLAEQRKPNYRKALGDAGKKLQETTGMKKWNAEMAIRRAPDKYEHIGLSAPDALARIRALVDSAEERRGGGHLVEHIKELATCLTFWPSATQVAEAVRSSCVSVPRQYGASSIQA